MNNQAPLSNDRKTIQSLRVSRILLPILIGLGAVGYLFWKQFDPAEFAHIRWTGHLAFWLLVALVLAVIRHLAYAARLEVLSHRAFSWKKSIELIFLWEFSSAVSPTSLGGSVVALFVLGKEKLPFAKTTTIVLYTIVLDGLFMLVTIPILYGLLGPGIMRPGAREFADTGVWGYYFVAAYLVMFSYNVALAYGIFVGPHQMKRLLQWLTGLPLLNRFRHQAQELGDELVLASGEMQREHVMYHVKAIWHTLVAWTTRFLLLMAIIIAFIPTLPLEFWPQLELYARLQTMFFVIAFSPTPGGAGLIELLFNGFLTDYVSSNTYATVISTSWRLLSYYVYLLAGAIIVPAWLRRVMNSK